MAHASLEMVKEALGIKPADTTRDSIIAQVLPFVDSAVFGYTHRDFTLNVPADPATLREFPAEDAGFTTVDDFVHATVTAVTLVDGAGTTTTLDALSYVPQPSPSEFPVGWYIETREVRGASPEMGFARNMDVLWPRYAGLVPVRMRVTAKWGWPAVPGAVTQAAIWTTVSFIENPRPFVSEAIQGYSRTMATPLLDAIPARARDLLGPYTKS